ncbi:MAG: GSCFA domain-containing protein [Cyanobacteria bacterium J06588_4]
MAADLVIITFGMTETWFDQETNLALAEAPSPRLVKEYPERFVYRSLSHQQCLNTLKSIYAILRGLKGSASKVKSVSSVIEKPT